LTFTQLARAVKSHLAQDRRYQHSVRVARCADVLAQLHDLDSGKARTAGMLHDLARLFTAERLLSESAARGLPVGDFERAHPMTLHARLGAAIARESFGVNDDEVLSAIEKHTTGAGEMSPLDCAVYLADSLEPGRTFAERAAVWEIATRDLAVAMREMLLLGIRHYARKGKSISPQTAAAARTFGLDLAAIPDLMPAREVHASAN
jgi:predicted HD superfamily hydrolase involved in NAD metabolism